MKDLLLPHRVHQLSRILMKVFAWLILFCIQEGQGSSQLRLTRDGDIIASIRRNEAHEVFS